MAFSGNIIGRLNLVDGSVMDAKFMAYQLQPSDTKRLDEDWASEHFTNYSESDLRDMFNLPTTGDYQIAFEGVLSGWKDSVSLEWDEEFNVERSQSCKINYLLD